MSESALSRQKLILALLAADPALSRKHSQFRDCLHYIPHYVSRLFVKTRSPKTSQIRCALKHKCPKCMDAGNILAARRPDFRLIAKAARYIGGGDLGVDCKVWLLSYIGPHPPTGAKLSDALSRSDSRHRRLLTGQWGGEAVCADLVAIVSSNSHQVRALFVFNNLVFASPEAELDVDGLVKRFPGIKVTAYHCRLGDAWGDYLASWSAAQVGDQSPEDVVRWMTSGARVFQPLGELRGVKVRDRAERLEKLRQSCGKSARIGFFHRLEQSGEVIDRIDRSLPLHASRLFEQPLSTSERSRIMALVKPQVHTVLMPPLSDEDRPSEVQMSPTELRARLDELKEMQARIIKALNGEVNVKQGSGAAPSRLIQ